MLNVHLGSTPVLSTSSHDSGEEDSVAEYYGGGEGDDFVCQGDHELKDLITTPHDGDSCHVCNESQPEDVLMLSCQTCEFSICLRCGANFP